MFHTAYLKNREQKYNREAGPYLVELAYDAKRERVIGVRVTDTRDSESKVFINMRSLLNEANLDVLSNLFSKAHYIPHSGPGTLSRANDFYLEIGLGLEEVEGVIELLVSEPAAPGFYDRLLVKAETRLRVARAALKDSIDADLICIKHLLEPVSE